MQETGRKRIIKMIILAVASLAVVAGIAWGTTELLSRFIPKKQDTQQPVVLTPQQQAEERAKTSIKAAADNESKGETEAAIAAYKEALKNYQEAGDKAGEEAVKLQIQYLESLSQQ